MHTTALCSPSRSCMLTGRNHHSNAMACITEGATGYPGSNGLIPFENGFLSEMLLSHGYNTMALGKWHLTPTEQCSPAGPYDRWPLGRGFERFYGFMGGDTSQYFPDLVYDNHQVQARPDARAGVPPDRGSRRPRDRVRRRRQAGRARQAVLHVLLHRRDARAPPRPARMGRPVQGPVRRRLGRLPAEGVRAPARARRHARRARSCPRAIPTSRPGTAWAATRSASTRA